MHTVVEPATLQDYFVVKSCGFFNIYSMSLKSIRVHLAAGSVEVKTVYITAHSNAHVSNICGRAKCACCVCTPGIRALALFQLLHSGGQKNAAYFAYETYS